MITLSFVFMMNVLGGTDPLGDFLGNLTRDIYLHVVAIGFRNVFTDPLRNLFANFIRHLLAIFTRYLDTLLGWYLYRNLPAAIHRCFVTFLVRNISRHLLGDLLAGLPRIGLTFAVVAVAVAPLVVDLVAVLVANRFVDFLVFGGAGFLVVCLAFLLVARLVSCVAGRDVGDFTTEQSWETLETSSKDRKVKP